MTLPETFFNPKQDWEKANHSSKKKTQGKKERDFKKISKVEKPKAVGHFLVQKLLKKNLKILISAHAGAKMS